MPYSSPVVSEMFRKLTSTKKRNYLIISQIIQLKNETVWKDNARVKQLKIYYQGRPYAILDLEDTRNLQYFNVGILGFDDASMPDWALKFEILDVYPGDKYADTVITELFFDGIDVH